METARLYFSVAESIAQQRPGDTKEKDIALIRVASQNYWYAGISAIEHILKTKASVPQYQIKDHNSRYELMKKHYSVFFSEDIHRKYFIMHKEQIRRKTAYKGENGNNFLQLKEFAEICMKELGNA
jgi:hypothetical protein